MSDTHLKPLPCFVSGLPRCLKDPNRAANEQDHVWDELTPQQVEEIREIHIRLKTYPMLNDEVLARLEIKRRE